MYITRYVTRPQNCGLYEGCQWPQNVPYQGIDSNAQGSRPLALSIKSPSLMVSTLLGEWDDRIGRERHRRLLLVTTVMTNLLNWLGYVRVAGRGYFGDILM